jgi:hypothetical protein
MDRGSKPPDERRQRTIEAVATFVALMHAHERGESAKAANAERTLERLGIAVRFGFHKPNEQKADGGQAHG